MSALLSILTSVLTGILSHVADLIYAALKAPAVGIEVVATVADSERRARLLDAIRKPNAGVP